jgi:argininosuccinate synthase
MKKKLVLAYSGGLDTTYCTHFLSKEKDFEIHTVIVNTGGFSKEELDEIEKKAYEFGSTKHICIDAAEDYYQKCIRYLIYGNVLRNRSYPVSVSSERTFQALKILQYASENNINTIAHGSTGAGNDQVRFESVIQILNPEIEVIAPIRDYSLSRKQEIDYLEKAGFKVKDVHSKYSINKGLWGTSIGGKETLSSKTELPDEAYPDPLEKQGTEIVEIEFLKGEAFAVNGLEYNSKIDLILALEKLALSFAIGRDVHVGETIIGIKGRVGFQAAAAKILVDAHYALEKHVLSKWQIYWKEQLGNWYGMFVHEAQFLDPVMRDIEAFLENSQSQVSGKVFVKLRPYHFTVIGIDSENDLMNPKFASYGEENLAWSGDDVKGFTKIMSNPAKIYFSINPESKPSF